jgi:heme exporter protein C
MQRTPAMPSRSVLPFAAIITGAIALVLIFLYAPTEALQGEVQRIVYVHAPAGWLMYLSVGIVALASIGVLAAGSDGRWQRWDRIAVAAAELGVLFTTIMLTTGPIWGRRVWGTWWVWDARLTATLVLWVVFVGYLLLRWVTPPGERRARLAAVIGIIGAADVPVIHFAVTWWRTLHPLPVVLRAGRPDLPNSMLVTLLVSFVAFTVLFAALLSLRIRIEEARDETDRALEAVGV